MKSFVKSALAALALVMPSLGAAAEYEIDATNSSVMFSVKHMMVSNVRGTFAKVTGTAHIDDKDPTRSTVEATIDAASVDEGGAGR